MQVRGQTFNSWLRPTGCRIAVRARPIGSLILSQIKRLPNKMIKLLIIGIALLFTGCSSMQNSTSLPVQFQVVDAGDATPLTNATVELQWNAGFQGYYWGTPVTKVTDSEGIVAFSSGDVPALSSDGYKLRGPITKLFITTLIVSAPGFEKISVKYPDNMTVIRMDKK